MEAITPPFSEEAERAVIGSILLEPQTILPIVFTAGIKKEWFYLPQCRSIYEAIEDLSILNKFLDTVTVCAHPKVSKDGLMEYAHKSVDKVATLSHVSHYLDIVKEDYYKRETLQMLREHESKLCSGDSVDKTLMSLMFDATIIDKHTAQKATREPAEIVQDILAMYEKCKGSGHVGLPSKWLQLQFKTSGYWKKKNTIVAARPGMGKSTFARNEARSWGAQGHKVAILSLEMDVDEVYRLMACELAEIDSFKYGRGEFTEEELAKFKSALDIVMNYPIYIADTVRDVKHICNWVRKINKKYDLDAVIYDYIQLITMTTKGKGRSNRSQEVSEISKALLEVAKECDIANVILSQINRGAEPPPNAKPEDRWKYVPRLQNLKESGALEEDAQQVFILYPKPDEEADASEMTVVPYVFSIEKNRGGPTGRVYTVFKKDMQRFDNAKF